MDVLQKVKRLYGLGKEMMVDDGGGATEAEVKERVAGVTRVEVATKIETIGLVVLMLGFAGWAVGSNAGGGLMGWKEHTMEGNGTFFTVTMDPDGLSYLTYVRIEVHFDGMMMGGDSFEVHYAAEILDDDGDPFYHASGRRNINCFGGSCTTTEESFYLPSMDGTRLLSWGNITASTTLRYPSEADPTKTPSVTLQVRSPSSIITLIVGRYLMIATLVYHCYLYMGKLLNAVDPLRPEHFMALVVAVLAVIYCNPFCALALAPSSSDAIGYFIYQLPQLYDHCSIGWLWGYIVTVEADSNTLPMIVKRMVLSASFLTFLQYFYVVSEGSPQRGFPTLADESTTSIVILIIVGAFRGGLWIRVVLGLNGSGFANMGLNVLKHTPYFKSRDRQIFGRMFTVSVLSDMLFQAGATIVRDSDATAFGTTGTVIFEAVQAHIFMWCMAPLHHKDATDIPPSPITNDWKKRRWEPIWITWTRKAPGAMCLYRFTSIDEEEQFWELQRAPATSPSSHTPSSNDHLLRRPCYWFNAFNYERCLQACTVAAECYKLDTTSACTSAVAGALIALAASVKGEPGTVQAAVPVKPLTRPLLKNASAKYTLLHVIQQQGMQVLFYTTERFFFIAFRGSSNIQNWLDDLKVPRVPWNEVVPANAKSIPMVHKGFLTLWNRLRDQVLSVVTKYYDGREVVVTGHSLGAAMAVLCSFTVSSRLCPVEVWTFGCPLVGNKAFAQCYNNMVPRCFRVVNENDFITRVHLTQGNKHVGHYVVLGVGNGWLAVDPPLIEKFFSPTRFLWNSAIAHSITNYQAALATSYLDATPTPDKTLPVWTRTPVAYNPPCCCCSCCCNPYSQEDVPDDESTIPDDAVKVDVGCPLAQ